MTDINKRVWSREDVFELIAMYQNNPILWDARCKDFNNRALKGSALEAIAEHFDTTADQVLKKVHNLRSQLAQELKKEATRKSKDGSGVGYVSKWPYFKVLSFLAPETPANNQLFQAMCSSNTIPVTFVNQPVSDSIMLDVPVEMGTQESYEPSIEDHSNSALPLHGSNESRKRRADSEPTCEEVLLKAIRVLTEPEDEYQVFGRYIASELRGLYSDESRRQLKRAIQRAVLEASEMDDVLRLNNHNRDPLATNH